MRQKGRINGKIENVCEKHCLIFQCVVVCCTHKSHTLHANPEQLRHSGNRSMYTWLIYTSSCYSLVEVCAPSVSTLGQYIHTMDKPWRLLGKIKLLTASDQKASSPSFSAFTWHIRLATFPRISIITANHKSLLSFLLKLAKKRIMVNVWNANELGNDEMHRKHFIPRVFTMLFWLFFSRKFLVVEIVWIIIPRSPKTGKSEKLSAVCPGSEISGCPFLWFFVFFTMNHKLFQTCRHIWLEHLCQYSIYPRFSI